MNNRIRVVACTALLLAGACQPEINANVEPVAAFYFERIMDSLPLDTSLEFRRSVVFDTTALESLTVDWTATEWTRFWSLVEKKQADYRSSAVKAAGK